MTGVARAVLDVLFASLWQGACVALAVGVAFGLSGRWLNAATRYIVLQGAVLTIAYVPLVTTLPNGLHRAWIRLDRGVASSRTVEGIRTRDVPVGPPRLEVALSDGAVLMLTGAWLIGVVAFTSRIALGSLQLARLVRRSRPLAVRAGVVIYASCDSDVPFACGFAAPAIVVPAALAVPGRQAFECIVLHELAHVKRGDAYGNACDRAMHALFYFNPSVLLLLRASALEREVACDDRAVAESRDLTAYTHSLATFAMWSAKAGSAFGSAATGFGRATVARIHRLEDARRNGAIALSHYVIGGSMFVFLTIAVALNAFGPAVAFAPDAPLRPVTIAAAACSDFEVRYLNGPAPERMRDMPKGLETQVRVTVSSSGKVSSVTIFKASGNVGFDRAVIAAAKKGVYAAQTRDCRPLAGSYIFDAMTG
jgi:TonB family protein